MDEYTVRYHNSGIEVSTMMDTVTDGSYRYSRLYVMYTEEEALEAFNTDVQTQYEIYGRA